MSKGVLQRIEVVVEMSRSQQKRDESWCLIASFNWDLNVLYLVYLLKKTCSCFFFLHAVKYRIILIFLNAACRILGSPKKLVK